MAKKPAYHRLDIYGAELHLATSAAQWAAAFIDEDVPDSTGLAHFAVFEPSDGGASTPVIVFWINAAAIRSLPELVDTVAHEAAHGACQLLDHLGHEVRGVDEPSAYLIGWLAGWLVKHTPAPTT